MQLTLVCLVLVGCVTLQVTCNQGHLTIDNSWHDIEPGCGAEEVVELVDNNHHQSACDECGASDCGGGCLETCTAATEACECSACSSTPTIELCSGADNCGCSSCQTITEHSCAPTCSTCSGISSNCGCSSCGPRVSVHHSKPIIVQPTHTSFVVPATPVIVQPHITHKSQQVNVHPRILARSHPTRVHVSPATVRLIKQRVQTTCCTESPCHNSGCLTCGGISHCSNASPCHRTGCSSCGGNLWHY